MTTHVFIVNENTFKIHLQYMFVGTGAGDKIIDFNNPSSKSVLHSTVERMLVSMIADVSRIRKGDFIIFYLLQTSNSDGKFYGIFKAAQDWSFLENYNSTSQYLYIELNKSLTFRTLIEPYKVYPEGVTEWEALDEIKTISSPSQMLWSLIYRKLKGNRGNTMITTYESSRLMFLIDKKNSSKHLKSKYFNYNNITKSIIVNSTNNKYLGNTSNILDILPRLIHKFNNRSMFEAHLQAYIVKYIGTRHNLSLDSTLLNSKYSLEWIGNEVSCGVGMQRIDVLLDMKLIGNYQENLVIPIELKCVEANINNTKQLQRYLDWLEQYYLPNKPSIIQPVLISKEITNKTTPNFIAILNTFKAFNTKNKVNLKYIEFNLDPVTQQDLVFTQYIY